MSIDQIKRKQIGGDNDSFINYIDTEISCYGFEDIIGQSLRIQKAKLIAQKAATSNTAVLITGESGTGKELFAHAIHRFSDRQDKPFVRVNCSCVPLELIEAELFGYEPGSFTGTDRRGKIGKLEYVRGGTVFIDEIGDMPLNTQAKLLRVLDEKEIVKIGAMQPRRVDFRLISATNKNLEEMVQSHKFRVDLLFRLNMFIIKPPSLREIKQDIPVIAGHFLKQLKISLPKKVKSISNDAMDGLLGYGWPGNVRELRNVVERAYVFCNGEEIGINDLPPALLKSRSTTSSQNGGCPLKEVLEKAERQAIMDALRRCKNNKKAAADLLGIHRTGLYQKMKKLQLH